MADISVLLNKIKSAVYGRDMRSALHDSIKTVNDDVEKKADKTQYASISQAGLIKLYSKNGTNRSGLIVGDDGTTYVACSTNGGITRDGAGGLMIKDGGVTENMFANGSVTVGKLDVALKEKLDQWTGVGNTVPDNSRDGLYQYYGNNKAEWDHDGILLQLTVEGFVNQVLFTDGTSIYIRVKDRPTTQGGTGEWGDWKKVGADLDKLFAEKADKQTITGGFVAGRNAEVATVEGTPLEYFYIGQWKNSTKLSYLSGNPQALYDGNNTGTPVNSAAQVFNVFDLGEEMNISSITLYVSDKGANTTNMVRLSNELPTANAEHTGVLRTNGVVQSGVPIIENKLSTDGYIKVGYTDGRYIGKYRYIMVFDWSNACTASEIYAETDTTETPIPAIQLGEGRNEHPGTFQVYNHQLLDENGKIPNERIPITEYSTTPQQIGTWVDSTPIWRTAFKAEFGNNTEVYAPLPLKTKSNALVLGIVTVFQNAGTPNMYDDVIVYGYNSESVDYTVMESECVIRFSSNSGYYGVTGYIEFATPESNLKTT